MSEEQLERPEVLRKLDELRDRLTQIGVSEEQLPEVQAIIQEQADLQSDLQLFRDSQFYDDAHAMYMQFSGQRYTKIDIAAKFLRRFAEHVVKYALTQKGVPFDEVVDDIPVMTERDK